MSLKLNILIFKMFLLDLKQYSLALCYVLLLCVWYIYMSTQFEAVLMEGFLS